MKKLGLGIFCFVGLALLMGSPVQAQEQPQQKYFLHQQPCDSVISLMMTIEKYREEPLFEANTISQNANGQWYEGKSMMFVNWETGTYSFVTLYPDGTGCMQAIGKEFKPYDGPMLYADQ